MRQYTKKRAKRNRECREWRRQLIARVGRCEICGYCPAYRRLLGWELYSLVVHEIARGPNREKAQDKRYATLVICGACHEDKVSSKKEWPEARQLAALKRSRLADYDLAAYNALVGRGPDRITESEVDTWTDSL